MKRFLIAVSCLSLFAPALVAPTLALGQASANQTPSTRPSPGQGGGGSRPGGSNRPSTGKPPQGHHRPAQPPQGHHRPAHPPSHRPGYRPGYHPGYRPGLGAGWNGHRYRAGYYRYPPGYAYRRWAVGQALPMLFLTNAYFFTNYSVIGIDPPPYGYQWVRYGPDVILVNVRTGQIMDVIRGVFY